MCFLVMTFLRLICLLSGAGLFLAAEGRWSDRRSQRLMRPVLQDCVVVALVGTLATVDIVGNLRAVPDGIAQGLQPAEHGLFGIGLGEPGGHAYRASVRATRCAAIVRRQ